MPGHLALVCLLRIKWKALKIFPRRSKKLAIALAGLVSLTAATIAFAVQPTVGLGSTSNYAVLAGEGNTNTGPTKVSGSAGSDMGSSPKGTFTGAASITNLSGTTYTAVDSKTTAAKAALVGAYNDAAGRTPATTVSGDLGGRTLKQGVYKSGSSLGLTGTLTLNGENNPDAVFIFQAGSNLTTASSSVVKLINGAQACHVFWQVASSATFGKTTNFVGHVFALSSINAKTGATFKGQLLARNGSVTLDTNTIINDACTTSASGTSTVKASATPKATPVTKTVTGGELPNTDAPNWAFTPIAGIVLIGIGGYALAMRRKRL